MNTEILAQIFTNYRQTKREHCAQFRAAWANKITIIEGKVFVPASYLRDLKLSDYRKWLFLLTPALAGVTRSNYASIKQNKWKQYILTSLQHTPLKQNDSFMDQNLSIPLHLLELEKSALTILKNQVRAFITWLITNIRHGSCALS